jgi:plasmid stability protein
VIVAQVVIRNIDDEAIQRLKARAARKGRSLEHELRTIITAAAVAERSEFRARAAQLRQQLAGRRHSDSTELIRRDRDR